MFFGKARGNPFSAVNGINGDKLSAEIGADVKSINFSAMA